MQQQSSGPGETIYLVEFERHQTAGMIVPIQGVDSPEARAEAIATAEERRSMGEAMAWSIVGDPIVVSATAIQVGAAF